MRIGVVNNLIAGKSQQQVGRMLDFLRSHPDVLHVETDDVGVMPEALAELARQEVALLVVDASEGIADQTLARKSTIWPTVCNVPRCSGLIAGAPGNLSCRAERISTRLIESMPRSVSSAISRFNMSTG